MSEADNTAIDEAEWQAQERALRTVPAGDADQRDAAYRLIAEAVQSNPRSKPPAKFVAEVVGCAAANEVGIEHLLSRVLLAVFLVASVIVGTKYSAHLWQSLSSGLGDSASGWAIVVTVCLISTWLLGRLLEFSALVKGRQCLL